MRLRPITEEAAGVREMFHLLSASPKGTAEAWKASGYGPEQVDGFFLLTAFQHHVEGLVYDALVEADWIGAVSPHIAKTLRRKRGLGGARLELHMEAMAELAQGLNAEFS